jgi:hypothetical protein
MYKLFIILLFTSLLNLTASERNSFINFKKEKHSLKLDSLQNILIYNGRMVNLYIEKVNYFSKNGKPFLLKFTVQNKSNKTIGVDLTEYSKVIFPNQWGIYNQPFRSSIDEEQLIFKKMLLQDSIKIINKFKMNVLTSIKPNQSVDYYAYWNGDEKSIHKMSINEFLIISIDGQMIFTDGEIIECLTMDNKNDNEKTIVFNYPVVSKLVSKKAMIID